MTTDLTAGLLSGGAVPPRIDASPVPVDWTLVRRLHEGTATALAEELKRRGFRFVGPTTAYALMQACGLVNDHLDGCLAR